MDFLKSVFRRITEVSFLIILLAALAFPTAAVNSSMYADQTGFEVGDIVTIVVDEDAVAEQQASTDASQSSDVDVQAGTGILEFIDPFGFAGSESSSADGATTRSGSLSAEITVQVAEVLENGNLKIEGNKTVVINDEEQEMKLSGIIQPEDVDLDNTVTSTNVANLDVEYKGRGVIGDKQRQGILSRIFNWIF